MFQLTSLPVLLFLPETGIDYRGLGLFTFKLKGELKGPRPSSILFGSTETIASSLEKKFSSAYKNA